ncbi:MFS transporter [Ferroplasma sp.]|uniref:MFS transporter n=1 Tax=Ferroplasma sp. TaxID=2591003 RepID=UPI00307FA696
MLNLHVNNIGISGKEFNKILPVFSYSIATFFLMDFAFFINDIVNTLHFTYLESFILLGIPFIGRMVTPFVYSYVGRIGVPRLALLSITLMAIISFGMGYETTFAELFASRFIIGIFFGLATSASIEVSSITGDRKIIGLTMGGWAIGWLIGAIFFMLLGSWELVSIAGIIFVPAVLFSKKHNIIAPRLKKFHFDFSLKVFLVFLLGFTPAYVLEIVPSYLGPSSFVESIVAYSIAVFAYLLLPALIIRFSLKKTLFPSLIIVAIAGILFFSTMNIIFAVVFTAFGLGINSLLPIISKNMNVESDKIGPSMNFSAIAGFIFPIILTIGNEALNSALVISVAAIFLLLFVSIEFGKHKYKSINIKKFFINH